MASSDGLCPSDRPVDITVFTDDERAGLELAADLEALGGVTARTSELLMTPSGFCALLDPCDEERAGPLVAAVERFLSSRQLCEQVFVLPYQPRDAPGSILPLLDDRDSRRGSAAERAVVSIHAPVSEAQRQGLDARLRASARGVELQVMVSREGATPALPGVLRRLGGLPWSVHSERGPDGPEHIGFGDAVPLILVAWLRQQLLEETGIRFAVHELGTGASLYVSGGAMRSRHGEHDIASTPSCFEGWSPPTCDPWLVYADELCQRGEALEGELIVLEHNLFHATSDRTATAQALQRRRLALEPGRRLATSGEYVVAQADLPGVAAVFTVLEDSLRARVSDAVAMLRRWFGAGTTTPENQALANVVVASPEALRPWRGACALPFAADRADIINIVISAGGLPQGPLRDKQCSLVAMPEEHPSSKEIAVAIEGVLGSFCQPLSEMRGVSNSTLCGKGGCYHLWSESDGADGPRRAVVECFRQVDEIMGLVQHAHLTILDSTLAHPAAYRAQFLLSNDMSQLFELERALGLEHTFSQSEQHAPTPGSTARVSLYCTLVATRASSADEIAR